MGFKKDWDSNAIRHWIQIMAVEINSPYNDGFVSSGVKKELWEIKCLLDDIYPNLNTFVGEEEWAKERMWKKLKQ